MITLVALLVQLSEATQGDAKKFYAHSFRNIELASGRAPRLDESEEFWAHLYHEAQLYIPADERLAVLVDEPHWLDFRRNPIWNLDMPGYSSLPPGMPFFKGSQALEDYLRGIGVHYLAFVSPERSKYHYRREYWLTMLVDETELWRVFAPYLLDTMDSLVEIAGRRKHVYDNLGITILDLEKPAEPKP